MSMVKIFRKFGLGTAMVLMLAFCAPKASDNSFISCTEMPDEEEGPYPYPGGEGTNPLNRSDITGGQTGVPLKLEFLVVNYANGCTVVKGARVDIWHCNKDGYFSGYSNQDGGASGTQSFPGETWLRGFQTSDQNGIVNFTTIYPGWLTGRATHMHVEVFVNGQLKKTSQIAFPETVSQAVYASPKYVNHGNNPIKNTDDRVFGDNVLKLAAEIILLTGNVNDGYAGNYIIGVSL